MADDVIYGYLDVQSPISTPLRVIDYDTQTTNNFINNEIEKRTAYGNGLVTPNLSEDAVISSGSVVGKIKVSKIPNGLFFNGKRAFTTAEREFNLPAVDGTYSVYLQAIVTTKTKTYTIDKATPNHTFSCPDIGMEFSSADDATLGVRIGRVTVSGGTMSVVDNNRDEAKIDAAQIGGNLDADELDILPKFNPDQFENDVNNKISLKTQLSRDSLLGHVKKSGTTGIEIFGKFEDGVDRYNQIAVKNIPYTFPEAVVSLGVDGLGGKLGGVSQNSFQNAKALIMAVIDGTSKGYGFYKQPKSDVSAASTDGNGNTVFTVSEGYLMNPLAMFYLKDNTNGGGEFVYGVSRNNSQLTVKGSLIGSYNYADDITIEQVDNFKAYNVGTGTEEFSGNTAWTGFFVDFDATPNIVENWITDAGQFLEKNLNDEYFASKNTIVTGKAWRTSSFAIPSNDVWTNLPLDAGNANLNNMSHSTVTNPERMTVNEAGQYHISASVVFHDTGIGRHAALALSKNGAIIPGIAISGRPTAVPGATTTFTISTNEELADGDYISILVATSDNSGPFDDVALGTSNTFASLSNLVTASLTMHKIA